MYKLEFPTQEEINKLEISAEKPYDPELDYNLLYRVAKMFDNTLYGISVSTWAKSSDEKYKLIKNLSFDDMIILQTSIEEYAEEEHKAIMSSYPPELTASVGDIHYSTIYTLLIDYISEEINLEKELEKWIALETAKIFVAISEEITKNELTGQEFTIQDIYEKYGKKGKDILDIEVAPKYQFFKAVWEKYLPTAIFRFKNNTADEKLFGNPKPI